MEYPLALALEDYLPVLFSIAGLVLLSRMIWRMDRSLGWLAAVGTFLIGTGGLMKATGKLVMAFGGSDVALLNLALFPLIAPGFTMVAWAFFQVGRTWNDQPVRPRTWIVPVVIIAVFSSISLTIWTNGGPWRLIFLLLATLANIVLSILLIRAVWQREMRLVAGLFLTNLLITLAMSQMAQIPMQTIALQWFEQLTQTVGQCCFLLASWQFSQQMERRYVPRLALQPL